MCLFLSFFFLEIAFFFRRQTHTTQHGPQLNYTWQTKTHVSQTFNICGGHRRRTRKSVKCNFPGERHKNSTDHCFYLPPVRLEFKPTHNIAFCNLGKKKKKPLARMAQHLDQHLSPRSPSCQNQAWAPGSHHAVAKETKCSQNMSLMIKFHNKLQHMLTTVADSAYPHQMARLTFWDQFQSHVN